MKPECPLCCCVPCNREIDAAVRRLHRWWRKRLLLAIAEPAKGKGRPKGERRCGDWGKTKQEAKA